MTAQKLDKDGDGASLDDYLGLLGRAGRDVGQSPRCLELNQGMGRVQELDKTPNDTSLDDPFDWRIAFFGQKFPEFGGGTDLVVNVVGEDTLDHQG
jgi:hypothetical protein